MEREPKEKQGRVICEMPPITDEELAIRKKWMEESKVDWDESAPIPDENKSSNDKANKQ